MNAGKQFLNADVGDFLRLSGCDEVAGDWRVNKTLVSTDTDNPKGVLASVVNEGVADEEAVHAYVIQRANGSREWFTFVVDETEDGGELSSLHRFEGVLDEPTEIDGEVNVESIAQSKNDLSG